MKMIVLILFVFSTSSAFAQKATRTLVFNSGARLQVEIADDFHSRTQGLMGRTHLPNNQGMLFIFPNPDQLSFWMKNTYIPLSIAFFDQDKVLKEIQDMRAQNMMEKSEDLTSYQSQCLCTYALEVNQGWFQKNGVTPGSRFELKDD
jgi:uncharacterized protein